jgi:hypothetical protein
MCPSDRVINAFGVLKTARRAPFSPLFLLIRVIRGLVFFQGLEKNFPPCIIFFYEIRK